MSTIETGTRFLRRFDDVWMRLKRVGLLKALSLGALLAIGGLALLVICDYVFELPHTVRVIGFCIVATLSIGVLATRVFREFRRWNQRHTAATIEKNFPELGQSVRTAIEFGETDEHELKRQGVVPGLVTAMQQQTDRITLPLDLLGVVKTGGLIVMVGVLCFLLGGLVTGSAVNYEWRTALRRVFLSDVAYTTASSPSGDLTVVEGENAVVSLEVFGRTDREVTLLTKPTNDPDAEWLSQVLTVDDRTAAVKNNDRYQFEFAEVDQPFDYRFVAGPASTKRHTVAVKYKLRIEDISVTIKAPEYTRLPPKTKTNSSLSAVENSHAVFDITFDRPPANATLVLSPMRRSGDTQPIELPLLANSSNGQVLTAGLDITSDWRFMVHAVDEDNITVESSEYSIRMLRDKAPRIWFEEPSEELEVHTLAEIMLRIRVTDDFGLASGGIVFEINNESEHTLVSKDFAAISEELQKDGLDEEGRMKPTTRATLEKLLPLEFFELTERDSVNYYAFATDNYPESPHETTTDLRFIDIRPFRRTYTVVDPDDPMGTPGGGEKIIFLGELIKRERALLNRTRRVATRAEAGAMPDTTTTSSLIDEQQTIADATLRLVDFLIARNFGGDELLFDAHEVMLTVIDSLAGGRFSDSVALERDAIKLLVEGRNTLEALIRKNPAKARAALRAFSRKESQKLRRPKSDEEEIAELVERLRELKREEAAVCAACSAMGGGGESGSDGSGSSGTSGEPTEADPTAAERAEEELQAADELRSDTEDRQNDVSVEARDIEAKMQGLDMLTDLAKERMAAAAAAAETAATSFERQDIEGAKQSAKEAGEKFGALANQVDALLKQEIAQRIAAARDLANKLAQQQQQLQMAMNAQSKRPSGRRGNSGNPGGTGENGSQGMGGKNGQSETAKDESGDEENPGDRNQDPTDPAEDGESDDPGDSGDSGKDDLPDENASDGDTGANSSDDEGDPQKTGGNTPTPETDGSDGMTDEPNDEKADGGGLEQSDGDIQGDGGSGTDSESESQKALADLARQLEEDGRTLQDLLKAIARSDRQEDQEAAGDVAKIMEDQQISDTVTQMQTLTQMVSDGEFRSANTMSADIGNRMQVTSQDLERLHRRIVAPRIDALMKLERRAVALLEKAKRLETDEDMAQWQQAARELLNRLSDAKLKGVATQELEDALRTGGGMGDSNAAGPRGAGYVLSTQKVIKDLQQRIQEMVLGDVIQQSDEAVPPEYERLVERYYQVLSDERSDNGSE